MSIKVKTFPRGPLGENTYIVTDETSGKKAVVDPGYFGSDVVSEIGDNSELSYIFLTHAHFDHYLKIQNYIEAYPEAKFVAPEKDKYLMTHSLDESLPVSKCPDADIYVGENDSLMLGDSEVKFFETPGHSEGSMCILIGDKLFSGDTLFRLSVGNTSFLTGSWDDLVASVNNKLYILDEDIEVYPGHGEATTIGFEKRANPFV